VRRLWPLGLIPLLVGVILGTATAAGSAQLPAGAIRGAGPPIKVSNTNPKPVFSAALKSSHSYKIVVRGTVSDWPVGSEYPQVREGEGVDALYCYAQWRCPKPELWRQLRVNSSGLDEFAGKAGKIRYSASHVYTVIVSGVAGKLTLVSSDAQSSPDGNSGAYTVEITDLGPSSGCRKPSAVSRAPKRNAVGGEEACEFRFASGARHPKNIRSPLGRHQGWASGAGSQGKIVDITYLDGGDIADWGIHAEFKVVGEHLRMSGPAKVLKLDLELTKLRAPLETDTNHVPKCREGMKGTVVLIDDNRLLPGGEADRGQTRDEVIVKVSSARCDYLEHTYTNADSHSHTPFVGGTQGSGGPGGRGGQWVNVRIST
jgi:hypothetical protein